LTRIFSSRSNACPAWQIKTQRAELYRQSILLKEEKKDDMINRKTVVEVV